MVDAPGYLVNHCLWVIDRAKGTGNGALPLIGLIRDSQRQWNRCAVMIGIGRNWLAHEKAFLTDGLFRVATPPFSRPLLRQLGEGSRSAFRRDWRERLTTIGPVALVVCAERCPYVPYAVNHRVWVPERRGLELRTLRLEGARGAGALADRLRRLCRHDGRAALLLSVPG